MNSPEPHFGEGARENENLAESSRPEESRETPPTVAPNAVSLQSIGEAPLLPPRDPLGARMAGSLGRHHSLLVAMCVVRVWAIVAMPPLWKRDPYTLGSAPGHD